MLTVFVAWYQSDLNAPVVLIKKRPGNYVKKQILPCADLCNFY